MKTEDQFEMQMQTEMEVATTNHAILSQQQPVQIIAGLDQAEEMISQSLRFVATLPKNKAVVEKFGVRMEPFSVHR